MNALARAIDSLNENIGVYSSYLVLPLVAVVGYEVFMRYAFNAPTIWAFELTTFIYGVHFILALGYTHKHNGHVAIDVVEARLSAKSRSRLRIMTNLVIFLPTLGLLSIWSVIYAADSWMSNELAPTSWAPAIYPYKIIMAVGLILFFLQGISKLLHDFRTLRHSA